jgi:sugar/nucleoside kinase (ribokinase family)
VFVEPSAFYPVLMAQAVLFYLDGFLFDGPESHAAFAMAFAAFMGAGGGVSITLSDPFCVERHRDAFRRMIREDVDLLFCNRAEMLSMYQTTDFDAALSQAAAEVDIVACTDSEHGAHILSGGKRWHAPAVPTQIVDATGAGDLFAGAFLWGLAEGHDLETCGRMGNVAASEVISHIGARPESELKALFRKEGLI